MSIKLMTEAWKAPFSTGLKIVLLAICDHAKDDNECFLLISTIATKCSMSKRSVFKHLLELEKIGAISKTIRKGRSSIYQVNPCRFCTGENSALVQQFHQPMQILHLTHADSAPITIKEPLTKPLPKKIIKKTKEIDLEFDEVWAIKVWRVGSNKTLTKKEWRARLTEGDSVSNLLAGAKSYAAYCTATQNKFLYKAENFFGKDKHYLTEWAIPADCKPISNGLTGFVNIVRTPTLEES